MSDLGDKQAAARLPLQVLGLLVLLAGCSAQDSDTVDPEEEAVRALMQRFLTAVNDGDQAAMQACMASGEVIPNDVTAHPELFKGSTIERVILRGDSAMIIMTAIDVVDAGKPIQGHLIGYLTRTDGPDWRMVTTDFETKEVTAKDIERFSNEAK